MLDYIALGMVLHEAKTGYDIKKEIMMGVGNFYKASYGSLYPALKKFTDKGYLTMVEKPHGKRIKKFYLATEPGRAALLEWLSSPFDESLSAESLLARIYFFGELPKATRDNLIGEYEAYSQQVLGQLKEIEKKFAEPGPADDRFYFELATLYYGLASTQTALRWFKHIKEGKPLRAFIQHDNN